MRQKRPSRHPGYELELAAIALRADFPFAWSGLYELTDAPITHLHQHRELELGYCHRGSGIFVVEDKVLPYQAGCISAINECEMHLAQSTPGTTSSWSFFAVDPARLLAGPGTDAALLATACLGGRDFANIIGPAEDPALCRLIELLVAESADPRAPGHREAVHGLMLAIMARLHRRPGRSSIREDSRGQLRRLAPALGYLGSHYHETVDIPTLAAVCACSPTHFRRQFTRAFGQGPLAYVVRFRLEKAAAMLRDGEASVLAVALRCGFNSLSAFQRHFRSAFGCSPRTWRRQTPT